MIANTKETHNAGLTESHKHSNHDNGSRLTREQVGAGDVGASFLSSPLRPLQLAALGLTDSEGVVATLPFVFPGKPWVHS